MKRALLFWRVSNCNPMPTSPATFQCCDLLVCEIRVHKTVILENIICNKETKPVSFQTFFTDIFLPLHFMSQKPDMLSGAR